MGGNFNREPSQDFSNAIKKLYTYGGPSTNVGSTIEVIIDHELELCMKREGLGKRLSLLPTPPHPTKGFNRTGGSNERLGEVISLLRLLGDTQYKYGVRNSECMSG